MGIAVNGHFACDTCGKKYRWKPELAGRKAKCKCGTVLICPTAEPAGEEEDIFDVAPDAEAPKSGAQRVILAPANALPVAPAAHSPLKNPVRAKTLAYGTEASAVDKQFPNPLMDLWAPIWVFAIAVAIEIGFVELYLQHSLTAMPYAMTYLFAYIAIKSVLLSIGIFIAAKVRQIKLGSLPSAILKLLAISIAPSATMDLVSTVTRFIPFMGFLLDWLCAFIIYFALIGTFFELDQEDTWYCVKTVFLINIAVALGFMWIMAHH